MFTASLTDESFKCIASVYRELIADTEDLEPGATPFALAEDETGIDPIPQRDPQTDNILGLCGRLCAKKCTHITNCRRAKCNDPHACKADGNYVVAMGTDYEELKSKMETSRVATLARTVVINPLDDRLCILSHSGSCLKSSVINTSNQLSGH